jgi:hypothetical protein
MDKDKVAKRDGKARSAPKISEQHTFIHADYEIALKYQPIEGTGPLVIAELKPRDTKIGALPPFVFRWDERANHLDVDPVKVSKAETSQFQDGIGGYYGHHTVRLSSSPRVFAADIGWHAERIYQGQITFNLAREVTTETALGLRPSIDVGTDKKND